MLIGNTVKIDGKELERVKKIKYLGAIIDNDLKLEAHIENMLKKTAGKMGYFEKLHTKKII